MLGKYLYDKVKKWWDEKGSNKEAEKNQASISSLLKEVEELKNKLESKDKQEINSEDLKTVKEQALKVESLGCTMKEDVFSPKAMSSWADNLNANKILDSDPEGLACFYVNILRKMIDNSEQLGLKRQKKVRLMELVSSVEVNLDEFLDLSEKVLDRPYLKDELLKKKYVLADTIGVVREAVKGT